MTEDLEIETYLHITPNSIGIYLFDIKSQKNLYKELKNLNNRNGMIDLNNLNIILEKNIFKIEKLIGKFIKKITLIIDDNLILNIDFGIKKKNYNKTVSRKNLENLLVDAKDLFKENFKNFKILHILLTKYLVDGNRYNSFEENVVGDFYCLELRFICIPKILILKIEKILEKYQISLNQCLDGTYINNLFKHENLEISEMAFKIQNGFDNSEIKLIPKNQKKLGIFEKFFQLFS